MPQQLYVDNGVSYRSHHLSLVGARLGIALINAMPSSPRAKARSNASFAFRTCRAQLISQLNEQVAQSPESINRRLAAWVEGECHHCPHRGLDGQSPLK